MAKTPKEKKPTKAAEAATTETPKLGPSPVTTSHPEKVAVRVQSDV